VTGDQAMLVVADLSRTYRTGAIEVPALRGVDLVVAQGSFVVVTGRSGSGKTTLLNCVGGLDRPDSGSITIAGRSVTGMVEDDLLALRRELVGFVFQDFALIPMLSARENIGLPLRLLRVAPQEREERVQRLLDVVGLLEHAEQRPYELSGGQLQRVAIARALVARPRLLLADEPTGQLDSATGRSIMRLIRSLVDSQGVTAVVATHDRLIIGGADEVHDLRDGRLNAQAAGAPTAAAST
jgi:putative ABC transport system ATP-binding protein